MFSGHLLPSSDPALRRTLLDGNFARREHPVQPSEYMVWDTALVGFGLRVRPSGRAFWTVRLRHRGKQRRVTIGRTENVDAVYARAQARRLLAEVALDGLPKRRTVKAAPTLTAFVEANWTDIARYWKPSTASRNLQAWRCVLSPVFGDMRVPEVLPSDVLRWRDDCAGSDEAKYNRAVPVLGSLFNYAEALHLRRKGSNPCRGLPRYPREAKERYLSPLEYRRLGAALRAAEARAPAQVAVIRLLLYTGARVGEIQDLRWEWIQLPRLALPDSKTGPKTIWLGRRAQAILAGLPRRDDCPFVFPNPAATAPMSVASWWTAFRRTCSMPDLRIHDLRHSFASTAIMDNVSLATIGKLLGHLLPETTARNRSNWLRGGGAGGLTGRQPGRGRPPPPETLRPPGRSPRGAGRMLARSGGPLSMGRSRWQRWGGDGARYIPRCPPTCMARPLSRGAEPQLASTAVFPRGNGAGVATGRGAVERPGDHWPRARSPRLMIRRPDRYDGRAAWCTATGCFPGETPVRLA